MLDTITRWTWAAGSIDMALLNFWVSVIGALAIIALAAQVSGGFIGFDLAGILRWVQRLCFGLLALAMMTHALYPLQTNSQPWLPGVALAGAITAMAISSIIARFAWFKKLERSGSTALSAAYKMMQPENQNKCPAEYLNPEEKTALNRALKARKH
jgi:hypothetical protein